MTAGLSGVAAVKTTSGSRGAHGVARSPTSCAARSSAGCARRNGIGPMRARFSVSTTCLWWRPINGLASPAGGDPGKHHLHC
jgi:hypothetical protein